MFKGLLNKEEKKIYNHVIRPIIIFAICIGLITVIGYNVGTLSSDEVNGYICALGLCMIINYINIAIIDLQNGKDE